jgi:hypothetical protein
MSLKTRIGELERRRKGGRRRIICLWLDPTLSEEVREQQRAEAEADAAEDNAIIVTFTGKQNLPGMV